MSKLVKLLVLIFVVFTPLIYAQECNISKNDIGLIMNGIKNNTLSFASVGFYMNLREESYHTTKGSEYSNYIKDKGIKNVLFETDEQYQVFISYLEAVKNKPCKFLKGDTNNSYDRVKMVFFNTDKKYTLHMYQGNEVYIKISLNITEGTIDDDSYDERSYIYEFKKINEGIVFLRLNPAG